MIRAAVMTQPNAPIEVHSFPKPVLEPGALLLRTIASEVCGTDAHLWHGRLSGVPYPIIPGHVSVGEVIEKGGEAHDLNGNQVQIGDVVTFLDVHETCHHCYFCCVAKASTRCPHRKVYGITYSASEGLLGGWSEQIYLKPGVQVIPLSSRVDPELWIAGGCGLPTALHAIDRAEIRLGDRVLIQGAGPVGLNACALANASGAGWVGVIDAVPHRLAAARLMGADHCFQLGSSLITEVLDETKGRGADIVIEASGRPEAVAQGCDMARDNGRYVIVGQYTDNGSVEINPHTAINRKHLEIRGCWGSDMSHFWRALEVMDRFQDRFDWRQLISRRYTLDRINEALSDVESWRVVKAIIAPNG